MTTTVSSNESKVFTNRIGFSESFYKFLGEDIKIGNQILYPGCYEFDYLIKLDEALIKAIGNEVIEFDKLEDNYLDVYPLISAV